MFVRDMTVSDVQRLDAQSQDADVAFVMDEDAFRAFYDRTSRAVWGYLVRLTGDRHVADDLLQDVYYRFLRASATYESEAHRKNSLFRIATNLARDAHRRRRVRPVQPLADETQVAAPGDLAGRSQQRMDLHRAMDGLKPRERAMLWLAYAEGSTHREIADTLGLTPRSVKLLLFRARRRLAGLLSGGRS
jgi:RNA polymerase sigma-70 factor (ECF subfamily)